VGEFIEERLPLHVRTGSSVSDDYAVEITSTASGGEYRRLLHPFPIRRWSIRYTMMRGDIGAQVKSLYDRCYKSFAGFRLVCLDDRSTAEDGISLPSASDQVLVRLSPGEYQLVKRQGGSGPTLAIGKAIRALFKPVAGSALVAVGGLSYASGWTLDATTGRVTFLGAATSAIVGITKAPSAVVDFGTAHGFGLGGYAHFSGVVGMSQINGLRGLVVALTTNTITVAIDSTTFSLYTSDGVANERPQVSETVTGGCYFDLPCRFDSALEVTSVGGDVRDTGSVDLIEVLDP
jgi:uncharacterized protein (TIGR02217 family)